MSLENWSQVPAPYVSVNEFTSVCAAAAWRQMYRGYSLVRTEDGSVVQRAEQLRVGETLEITLRKGSVSAEVREIREDSDGREIEDV